MDRYNQLLKDMETWKDTNRELYNKAKVEFDQLQASLVKPIIPKPLPKKKK